MKKKLHALFVAVTVAIQFLGFNLFAQNVGINTQTPQARLHIFKGSSGYVGVYPHQDLIIESNDHTWINLLSPDDKEMGLLFGKPSNIASGGIVYDINNNMHFRTNGNVNRMFIGSDGNVGIGTVTPNAPLSFPAVFGDKITLYPGTSGNVGFGVQGNLFQMFADHSGTDIAFGYGTSIRFIENMRIRGNGNVGIGTSNPSNKLEVAGNIEANSYVYSAPKTSYYSIPAAAFSSVQSDNTMIKEADGELEPSSAAYIDYIIGYAGRMVAPINLPHGANITQVKINYHDDAPNVDLVFEIIRRAGGGTKEIMGSAFSITGGTTAIINSLNNPVIDNSVYNYHVLVYSTLKWPATALTVRGVFITYTLSSAQ